MNTKLIEGIKSFSEGFNLILEALTEEAVKLNSAISESTTEEVSAPKKSSAKTSKKEVKETEDNTESSVEFTEEELNSMSYNELKKLAKELGVSATGSRKELVKKLLSGDFESADESEDEEEEASKKSSKTVGKSSKKSAPVEDEEDEEDEDEDEEPVDEEDDSEDDEDSVESQVNALVEDMTDDELKELLDSVNISSRGKRQALISKIITAVEDGLISLEEDEEDSEGTDDEEPEKSESKSSDVTEGMTKKRKKAYKELCDETSEQFENGDITREDLIDFINEFNGTSDKMKKVSDEDLLTQYLEISAMLIDDDGEIVEEGAYYINEEPYCCGKPLTYNKKKKQYVCEHCGAEYDEE